MSGIYYNLLSEGYGFVTIHSERCDMGPCKAMFIELIECYIIEEVIDIFLTEKLHILE